MLAFASDYMEGAHEEVLQHLMKLNMEHNPGYGTDVYCDRAKEKIKSACECPEAEIFFLVGGTQTNQVAIDTMLESYEGVVAAATGHVSLHEAGAIEYTGHKVLNIPRHDGKIDAKELAKYLETYYADENHEHMVFPGMCYISHPTEYGTLYAKEELKQISEVCHKYDMPLYLDGARLGYGLMSKGTDVTLPVLAKYCDAFYIGGTKVGALFGEALIFTGKKVPKHFLTRVKQHGALLAKGFLLGAQFEALFTDHLYERISSHAVELADYMKKELVKRGCKLYLDSPTNQQFFVVENEKLSEIADKVMYSFWEPADKDHTVIRFATSWATKKEDVEELLKLFE